MTDHITEQVAKMDDAMARDFAERYVRLYAQSKDKDHPFIGGVCGEMSPDGFYDTLLIVPTPGVDAGVWAYYDRRK